MKDSEHSALCNWSGYEEDIYIKNIVYSSFP